MVAVKKRGRLEVMYDIVSTIRENNNSLGPTRLQYQSNLSPQMFREYIAELLEKKFILEFTNGKKRLFSLTQKGFSFIEQFEVIQSFVDDFNL